MGDQGFATIVDAAAAIADRLGLTAAETIAGLRVHRGTFGRYEDLCGGEFDRICRLVWDYATGGAPYPWDGSGARVEGASGEASSRPVDASGEGWTGEGGQPAIGAADGECEGKR